MITKKYKIAERVIEISSIYERVHCLCRNYETDEPVDFSVAITEDDIALEKQKTESEYAYEGLPVPDYTVETYESTAVYRKIAEKIVDYDTFVFHGSAIAVDGQAFLFTAKSGTGKSTHTRLWREYFGEKAIMVNDDKPMICVTENSCIICGTPYNGKHHLGANIAVPLKAICILTRGEENHIERISKSEAFSMLMQQIYRPKNPLQMAKTLKLVDKMMANVELYKLACNMDIKAAEVAYNGMK
jgi:hypothetical protein